MSFLCLGNKVIYLKFNAGFNINNANLLSHYVQRYSTKSLSRHRTLDFGELSPGQASPVPNKLESRSLSLDMSSSRSRLKPESKAMFVKGVTMDDNVTDPDADKIPLLKIDECTSEDTENPHPGLTRSRRSNFLRVNRQPRIAELDYDITGASKSSPFPWQRNIAVQVMQSSYY